MDGVTSMQETKVETSESKRRKLDQKTIVRVRAEANAEKQKGEGPPSDSWSWRKYGQKPIKGSPYPRGYYRCSTSKGCSAKKQVERCRTDASMIIITYTSDHNHPGPHLSPSINQDPPSDPACPEPEQSTATCGPGLKAPTSPLFGEAQAAQDQLGRFGGVGPIPCSNLVVASSTSKSSEEEDDFFDELEELPISSSFTGLVRSSFFDERILLPS